MPTRLRLLAALAFAFPLLTNAAPPPEQADVTVSVNVIQSCTISATDVNFGDYDPLDAAADDDGEGTLNVRCSKGHQYKITFLGARVMTGPTAETLAFELYPTSARAAAWVSEIYEPAIGRASITEDVITVFGRIPAGQDVPVGAYSTTVQAEINL
jgi:spore coat protein U-like protein